MNEEILDQYLHGDCAILAVHLAKISGYELQAMFDYSEELDEKVLVHAFVKFNNDYVIDASGFTTIDNIENEYHIETGAWVENVSEQELLKINYGNNIPKNDDVKQIAKKILDKIKTPKYYHGSCNELRVGDALSPRKDYEKDWDKASFYNALEAHKPLDKISHKDGVFMVGNIEDVDLSGGATEYIYKVEPIGKIEKHDINWSSEISCLIDSGYGIESDEVKQAAENYWNSVPHTNESVWEYIASEFKITSIIDSNDREIVPEWLVYNEAQKLHHTPEDFYEGNLSERLEMFTHYVIGEVDISELDLDEFNTCDDRIEEFLNTESEVPPIIYDSVNQTIIDGIHRANAAALKGHTKIKSYIGTTDYIIESNYVTAIK